MYFQVYAKCVVSSCVLRYSCVSSLVFFLSLVRSVLPYNLSLPPFGIFLSLTLLITRSRARSFTIFPLTFSLARTSLSPVLNSRYIASRRNSVAIDGCSGTRQAAILSSRNSRRRVIERNSNGSFHPSLPNFFFFHLSSSFSPSLTLCLAFTPSPFAPPSTLLS